MSNLLQTQEGRAAVQEARNFLLRRRLSRFFKRNLVIDFSRYQNGLQEFDLETILGELNPAHDNEILELYRLLGTIGGLDQSLSDVTVYVDADNGDDDTGTGSSLRPMASLWFLPYLPKNINHIYRIILRTDVDMSDTVLSFDQTVGPNGCLTIAGNGEEEHVEVGLEGTITANTSFNNCSEFSVINPAPVANCRNAFVQATSGTYDGSATPVFEVDNSGNDEICTHYRTMDLSIGNTVRYIRPRRLLTVKGLSLNMNLSGVVMDETANQGSRFCVLNLRIEIDDTTPPSIPVLINTRGNMLFSFVQIKALDTDQYFITIDEARINERDSVDTGVFAELGLLTLANLFPGDDRPRMAGLHITEAADNDTGLIQLRGNVSFYNVCCYGKIQTVESNCLIRFVSCGVLDTNISNSAIWYCQVKAPGTDAIIINESHSNMRNNSFLDCTCCILSQNSRLSLSSEGVDTTYANAPSYALTCNWQSKLTMLAAWVGASGTIADIFYTDTNPDSTDPFPAAGFFVSDTTGNVVSRIG